MLSVLPLLIQDNWLPMHPQTHTAAKNIRRWWLSYTLVRVVRKVYPSVTESIIDSCRGNMVMCKIMYNSIDSENLVTFIISQRGFQNLVYLNLPIVDCRIILSWSWRLKIKFLNVGEEKREESLGTEMQSLSKIRDWWSLNYRQCVLF